MAFWKCLFLTGLACVMATPAKSGCGTTPPRSGKYTMTNQLRERQYYIHIPRDYDNSKPSAVVLLFHGWGYSGAEWTQGSGFGAVSAAPTADAKNFILVAPTGLSDKRFPGNW